MKFIAQRLLALGFLFLLSPVWTFPFIHEIAVQRVVTWEHASNFALTLLGFDDMLFRTEYMTYYYLFATGVWISFLAIFLRGFAWMADKKEARQAQIAK
jgi:hypothetical protein